MINLAQIWINEHKPIFDDLLDALLESMREMGIDVVRSENRLLPDRVNILVGATVFQAPRLLEAMAGKRCIAYQMECLSDQGGFLPHHPAYDSLLRKVESIWDYSQSNVAFLRQRGYPNPVWVRPGYHPVLERVPKGVDKTTDVLFFGAITQRRARVLSRIEAAGLSVKRAFGVYGEARNRLIAEARVVLNMHQHDGINVLEEVRLSFLLANGCFVVSEASDWNPYGEGVVYADYDSLPEACVRHVRDDASRREAIARIGRTAIMRTTMRDQLLPALLGMQPAAVSPPPA